MKRHQMTESVVSVSVPASKRPRNTPIVLITKIIVRNDIDLHVLVNINCTYVKIGNYIFKAKPFSGAWLNTITDGKVYIAVTTSQLSCIRPYISGDMITVTSYYNDPYPIEKLELSLTTNVDDIVYIDYDYMIDQLLKTLNNHIIRVGQILPFAINDSTIYAEIINIDSMIFGIVNSDTEIFINFTSQYIIMDTCIPIKSECLQISIIKCVRNNTNDKYSEHFDETELEENNLEITSLEHVEHLEHLESDFDAINNKNTESQAGPGSKSKSEPDGESEPDSESKYKSDSEPEPESEPEDKTECDLSNDDDICKSIDISEYDSMFPLLISNIDLDSYVRSVFSNSFIDNDERVYLMNDIDITFNVKIRYPKSRFYDINKFKKTYKLIDDRKYTNDLIPILSNPINVSSNINSVIVTKNTTIPDKICFTITSHPICDYDPIDYIIDINEMTSFVFKNIKKCVYDQPFIYPFGGKKLYINVSYVEPYDFDTLYIINSDITKITFKAINDDFILVKNKEHIVISEIIFKIKVLKSSNIHVSKSNTPCSPNKKIQEIDSKKFEKIVRNLFPEKTAKSHSAIIKYDNVNYKIIVKKITFDNGTDTDIGTGTDADIINTKYEQLGLIDNNTIIKFITSPKDKFIIVCNEQSLLLKNPLEELSKYVGGMTDELKKIIQTICISRGKFREEYLRRGLKPVKGIILYGPPGTGKTSLARNLGQILGCDKNRISLISGSQIFNKYVGESEKNVRNIFQPAKNAWKKQNHKSPLYMVVIDEIDAMLPCRSGNSSNGVRESVVNTFLSEIDGLVEFNNLVCIGITNRLELLDEAVLRNGRFGLHVKIDLPDNNGRKEIFNIHTSKLINHGLIDDIDFGKLALLTDKCNGADIERIVELASTYSLVRLEKMYNKTSSNQNLISDGKILMSDFTKAVSEVNSCKNKNDSSMCSHIYM